MQLKVATSTAVFVATFFLCGLYYMVPQVPKWDQQSVSAFMPYWPGLCGFMGVAMTLLCLCACACAMEETR